MKLDVTVVQGLQKAHDFEIVIFDIRAWKPNSASVAKSLDPKSRYDC